VAIEVNKGLDIWMQRIFARVFRDLPHLMGLIPLSRQASEDQVQGGLDATLDFVVDKTLPAFRALVNYRGRLKSALMTSLAHIDTLVEQVPAAFVCSRSTYFTDPRVRAFFINPTHLGEVFSASEPLRALFDTHQDLQESWGLLCMRHERQLRFGTDLVNGQVVKDVRQEVVNFTDHEFLAPGPGPGDARRGLKCCILKGLIEHIHTEAQPEQKRGRNQGRRPIQDEGSMTLNQRFDLVLTQLSRPEDFVSLRQNQIWLDHMGVVREPTGCTQSLLSLELSEIEIASKGGRIGALVGFSRDELQPVKNLRQSAERFLAI
jgi:hypothetical protein